ncbi:YceH family protein [Alteromonas sp. H39]|uniref:YceH family protein n=1 Tax=Alteromonas sp. H39 TaxID=3389876 RepID=UPI0039DFE3B5
MMSSLNEIEIRIIGVLLEKSVTTPEQYPLSVNALTNGCNQKSNRAPVMQLSETEVRETLDSLKTKRLVQVSSGFGSRVDKITHRFCNTEFGDLKLSEQQLAIIAELFLRGPQTPGELRGRCSRMAHFSGMADMETALESLQAYQPDPLIRSMPREPGKREIRYQHCFGDSDAASEPTSAATEPAPRSHATNHTHELDAVKQELETLRHSLAALSARVAKLEQPEP